MKFGKLLMIRMQGYKQQAITLFLFSIMFSVIILGATVVDTACFYASENVGKYSDGNIQIKSYDEENDEEEDKYTAEGQRIVYDWVEEFGADHRIKNYELTSMAGVHGVDVHHKLLNHKELDEGDEKGNLLLVYEKNMLEHYIFSDLENSVIDGRKIKTDETGSVAVVSKTFSEENMLSVGDMIELQSLSGKKFELEIVGISSCEYYGDVTVPVRAAEYNFIFTTKEIVDLANQSTNVFKVDFSLADCKDADAVMNDMQKELRGKGYSITSELTGYYTILGGIMNTRITVSILQTTAVIMGMLIIGLFSIYSFTRRLKEIGILISIGLKKSIIVTQYVLETFLPVFAGNLSCLAVYLILKKPLTYLLLHKLTFIPNMSSSIHTKQILVYFGYGLFMMLFSAIFVWYTVVKYNPKKLLIEVDEP